MSQQTSTDSTYRFHSCEQPWDKISYSTERSRQGNCTILPHGDGHLWRSCHPRPPSQVHTSVSPSKLNKMQPPKPPLWSASSQSQAGGVGEWRSYGKFFLHTLYSANLQLCSVNLLLIINPQRGEAKSPKEGMGSSKDADGELPLQRWLWPGKPKISILYVTFSAVHLLDSPGCLQGAQSH